MTPQGTRTAGSAKYVMSAALVCVFLASCSSTSEPDMRFSLAATLAEAGAAAEAGDFAGATVNSAAGVHLVEAGDPSLPDMVNAAPTLRPGSDPAPADPGPVRGEVTAEAASPPISEPATAAAETSQPFPESRVAEAPVVAPPAAAQVEDSKRGFLSALFSPSRAVAATPSPIRTGATPGPLVMTERPVAAQAAAPATRPRPVVEMAATSPLVQASARSGVTGGDALPGVRNHTSLFEISRRSGLDDDSDIDLHEDEGPYRVASAAGLARLAPNGLLKQHDAVDVACLKPSLVRVLKAVESHFGRKVVITSGFRSPERNRRARGARNSLHMFCAAADVQVPGVAKAQLAQFVRTMPGRGGVGTYCHTESVHIDVGPERDWNWRCRRRR